MHFILDNLLATIVAGTIFMVLVGISARKQDAALETANFYSLRQQQLAFIDILKRDMKNVSHAESVQESGNEFSFYILPPGETAEHRVTYRRVPIVDTNFFRVERWVTPPTGPSSQNGTSMSTIAVWEIRARNENGQPVVDPQSATQIYVRFEAEPPLREGKVVRRARWEASFRPPMIQPNLSL